MRCVQPPHATPFRPFGSPARRFQRPSSRLALLARSGAKRRLRGDRPRRILVAYLVRRTYRQLATPIVLGRRGEGIAQQGVVAADQFDGHVLILADTLSGGEIYYDNLKV